MSYFRISPRHCNFNLSYDRLLLLYFCQILYLYLEGLPQLVSESSRQVVLSLFLLKLNPQNVYKI